MSKSAPGSKRRILKTNPFTVIINHDATGTTIIHNGTVYDATTASDLQLSQVAANICKLCNIKYHS